ncbi:Serine/threonine-protein kinase PrkC [Rubripirellula obstinata]|uniref:non-specific serine/threonine protein kinase n=1 Tax=Rubripirellula obstinata TaxID=406547 RepID=A0A5B1CK77_9BACT|nr:serine/threonine-protein kinase [Rubripirellula obstinata]KAA1259950.1 Serine/threonine-protein kinase PrkC [Rubripirellula obstinata]
MSSTSNVYAELLGLPESTIRPCYFELLGLDRGEGDPRVIKAAYYRRVAKMSARQDKGLSESYELLLVELAEARDCLMDESSRKEYGQNLAKRAGATPTPKRSSEEKRQARAERERIREALRHRRTNASEPATPFSIAKVAAVDDELKLKEPASNVRKRADAINQGKRSQWTGFEDPGFEDLGTETTGVSASPKKSLASSPKSSSGWDSDSKESFDTASIAVAPIRPRLIDRFNPILSPAEMVSAMLGNQTPTDFQSKVLDSANPCSLVLGSYLIETQLHSTSAVCVDDGYQVDGGLDQRSAGWGPVYLASRMSDGHRVTIRILPPNFRQELTPLRHWVNKSKQIDSPVVCHAIESGRDEKRIFLVNEFMPGEDLYRLINRIGPMSLGQAMHVVISIIDSLIAAKNKNLTHPELRPGKVIVDSKGRVSVRDFALGNLIAARKQNQPDPMQLVHVLPADHVQFSAPERFRKVGKVDDRAEMYSLGCILRYLLTGRPTFELTQSNAIVAAHQSEPMQPVSKLRREMPPELDLLIRRLTAKAPEQRFSDFDQVKKSFMDVCRRWQLTRPTSADWLAVSSVAPAAASQPMKVGRWHKGRLIRSVLLSSAGVAALLVGGTMAFQHLELPSSGTFLGSTDDDAAIKPKPVTSEAKPVGPRVIRTQESAVVPVVESVDAFLLD